MQEFIRLWQHRYRKYSDIFNSYFAFLKLWLLVKFSRLKGGRPVVGILLAEHFGDIVAAEPLIATIRQRHPTARLWWVARRPYRELVEYHPEIEAVIEEKNVLFSDLLARHPPFDAFYNLHLSNRVYPYLNRRLVNPVAERLNLHVLNYLHAHRLVEIFAKMAGLPPPSLSIGPKLYWPAAVDEKVSSLALPQPYVVIHTTSNPPPRDWNVEGWRFLIGQLIEHVGTVVEVGLHSPLQLEKPGYLNLCGQLSLLETAAVIKGAALYVGIDSGPAHLANAVGTYGFILMGRHVIFDHYDLYSGGYNDGSRATIIRNAHGPAADLTPQQVWQPIHEFLIGRRMGAAFRSSLKPL